MYCSTTEQVHKLSLRSQDLNKLIEMATTLPVLLLLATCAVVYGQQAQQALWPPHCCLENQLTMTFRKYILLSLMNELHRKQEIY